MVNATTPPMEMRQADVLPDGPGWQFEPKWDGFRCLAHRDGERVCLTSKNGQPLGRYFPDVVAALRALDADRFSLDGELLVSLDGTFSFEALQQRIHPAGSRVATLAAQAPARYLVFDALRLDGEELIDVPLERRRPALEAFAARFPPSGDVRLSPATTSRAVADVWFSQAGGALDGVVAKKLGVPYASGRRDAALKIKKRRTADCVVGGFRFAQGSKTTVGSLLLGLYDEEGRLDHVGFCSAFPAVDRAGLLARLAPYRGGPGFTGTAPDTAPSRWARGERDRSYEKLEHALVLEVEFDLVTAGHIRHGTRPVRWRPDKAPQACTRDQLAVTGDALAFLAGPALR